MVEDEALLELLRHLAALDYDFVTPTPLTHQRVLHNRRSGLARSLRDIFGWSLPFSPDMLDAPLAALLERADATVADGTRLRSRYRVSRVAGRLFLHSAFPTSGTDSVFLGPDSYRFVTFVTGELKTPPGRLIDMGAGCGVGAICAAAGLPETAIVLVDSNSEALRLARINAAAAGIGVETHLSDSLAAVEGDFDLVIANPPYLVDETERTYRHGGAMLGAEVSLDWATEAARRLAPGGRMLLYTGSAIVDGRDALKEDLADRLPDLGCRFTWRELDPDIFGEELEREAYRCVERIAAVGLVIEKIRAEPKSLK